jgi:hypothetical protein
MVPGGLLCLNQSDLLVGRQMGRTSGTGDAGPDDDGIECVAVHEASISRPRRIRKCGNAYP